MSDQQLRLYSLIKTFYDQNNDYIECFCPLIMRVLEQEHAIPGLEIQKRVQDQYGIRIPMYVLERIVHRLEKSDACRLQTVRNYWEIRLSQKGAEATDQLETERDVTRRVNELVEHLLQFVRQHQASAPDLTADPMAYLDDFVKRNVDPLVGFLLEGGQPDGSWKSDDRWIIEFLRIAETRDSASYLTFSHMIHGALLTSVLNYSEDEFDAITKQTLQNTKIFYDANFLFSLLGLHAAEFSVPAEELHRLLSDQGVKFRAYDFTIAEMARVLDGYLKAGHEYPQSVRVDSLYGNLKWKHWTTTDVREFVATLDNRLAQLGIFIKNTDVDLTIYDCPDGNIFSLVQRNKPIQGSYYQAHDTAVLYETRRLRKRKVRKIEDAKIIFLTSDHKLASMNFHQMGHKSEGTIPEVVLDRLLTNILYLKRPKGKWSIHSLIAAHSRGLFVRRGIWEKFYANLKRAKDDNRLTDEKITALFYHGFVESVLTQYDDQDADKITEDLVVDVAEEAARNLIRQTHIEIANARATEQTAANAEIQRIQNAHITALQDKETEFLQTLGDREAAIRLEADNAHQTQVHMILAKIDTAARTDASRIVSLLRVAIGALLALPLILLLVQTARLGPTNVQYLSVASVIRYAVFILDFAAVGIGRIWDWLQRRIERRIATRRKARYLEITK